MLLSIGRTAPYAIVFRIMNSLYIHMSTINPIQKCQDWLAEETHKNTSHLATAGCLSTLGDDGYPNARFISLKAIVADAFVITGPLNTRKGAELLAHPKAALTFWWPTTQRQLRIQGDVQPLEAAMADVYFSERSKDAQLVSMLCQQGEHLESYSHLQTLFHKQKKAYNDLNIKRPIGWSGFYIIPQRMELMEFKESRLHLRELYTRQKKHWNKTLLQP
jgi:pyridoxamine 5'-phosphate oxidase